MSDEHNSPPGSHQRAHLYQVDETKKAIDDEITALPTHYSLDPPRKRSNSVLHWMHKTFSHAKSSSRQRSSTTTHTPSISPSVITPTVNQPERHHGRQRSSTVSSVQSTSKKTALPKKIISDTDQAAQQSPSLFQFVFMR